MRVPRSLNLRENVPLDEQIPQPSADLEMRAPKMIAPYEDDDCGGTELDHPVGLGSPSMVWEAQYDFMNADDDYSMRAPARNIRADSLVVEEFLDEIQEFNSSFQEFIPQSQSQEVCPDPSGRQMRERQSTPKPRIMSPRPLAQEAEQQIDELFTQNLEIHDYLAEFEKRVTKLENNEYTACDYCFMGSVITLSGICLWQCFKKP
ncbi:unnamed protein product [Oikopleura dioica]|nr:unnamed protein product [Oikopleura dioica]